VTTTIYGDIYAGILSDFEEFGAAVTFTPGTRAYNPSTNTLGSPQGNEVSGLAISVRGESERYRALGLVEDRALTVLFRADAFGEKPALGSVFTWADNEYNVDVAEPVAPGGDVIITRVIGHR
jgi:hypothetical protein